MPVLDQGMAYCYYSLAMKERFFFSFLFTQITCAAIAREDRLT
jgi:hypothetical protein